MFEKLHRAINRMAANERRDSAELCSFLLALVVGLDRLNLAVTMAGAATAERPGNEAHDHMRQGEVVEPCASP